MCDRRPINHPFSQARKGIFISGDMDTRIVFPEFVDESKRVMRNDPLSNPVLAEVLPVDEMDEERMLEIIDASEENRETPPSGEVVSPNFPKRRKIGKGTVLVSASCGFDTLVVLAKGVVFPSGQERFSMIEYAPKFVGAGRRR